MYFTPLPLLSDEQRHDLLTRELTAESLPDLCRGP
jgi:hypothetical protein